MFRAVVSCVLLQGAPEASLSPVHSFPVCPATGDGGREDDRWRSRSSDPVVMNPFDGSGSPRHEEADGGDSRCPWARFSSWLECVCVVTFDLELGQAIEVRSCVSLASLASCIIRDASDKTEINDWWILNRPLPYTSLMFCGRCTKLCSKNGPFFQHFRLFGRCSFSSTTTYILFNRREYAVARHASSTKQQFSIWNVILAAAHQKVVGMKELLSNKFRFN